MHEQHIKTALQTLGITPTYKGCPQAVMAVKLALEDRERLQHEVVPFEQLWKPVAAAFGCAPSAVERNFRTLAHTAWRGNRKALSEMAGGCPMSAPPKAARLLAIVTAYVARTAE